MLSRFAREQAGCTERCTFEVEAEFLIEAVSHVIRIRHNGRETHRAEFERGFRPASTFDVMRVFEPWLRGLHRFPVETGIK